MSPGMSSMARRLAPTVLGRKPELGAHLTKFPTNRLCGERLCGEAGHQSLPILVPKSS